MKKFDTSIDAIYKFALDNFSKPFTIEEFHSAYTKGRNGELGLKRIITTLLVAYSNPNVKRKRFVKISRAYYAAVPIDEFHKIMKNDVCDQIYSIFKDENCWLTVDQIQNGIKAKFKDKAASLKAIKRSADRMTSKNGTKRYKLKSIIKYILVEK